MCLPGTARNRNRGLNKKTPPLRIAAILPRPVRRRRVLGPELPERQPSPVQRRRGVLLGILLLGDDPDELPRAVRSLPATLAAVAADCQRLSA